MLKNIHVKNFALIDEVEIDLTNGLNVLTGETGAGKSIIIDAVNYALGQKVSKDVVREDSEYALAELIFSATQSEIKNKLEAFGISCEDDEIILSRKITNGKSTARINGETVPISTLKSIAMGLIDIHGQHDNQSLLYKSAQLNLLDSFLDEDATTIREKLRESYVNYTEKKKELEELDGEGDDKELAFLTFQLKEIEAAAVKPGEDDELETLYRKMSNAKKIAEAVSSAHRLTGYDYEGAGSNVGRALSQIRMISDLDDEAKDLELILTDIDSLLNDFNRTVADYESTLEFSDEEFNEIESRINVINSLKSKYGRTIELVLEKREELINEIEKLQNIDEYKEKLTAEVNGLHKEVLSYCEELSKIRISCASDISREVENSLVDLNLLDARFEIKVSPNENNLSSKGYDDVELFICTNPGEKLKPLNMVASGGEMSRIMLALKSVMAKNDQIPTLIFDEIDTGISGRTAQKVSEKMATISKDHQVILVTHLPQIAAMADSHFEISKKAENGRTITSIKELSEQEIVLELARMLGGVTITDAVLENAKEMKKQADAIKQ